MVGFEDRIADDLIRPYAERYEDIDERNLVSYFDGYDPIFAGHNLKFDLHYMRKYLPQFYDYMIQQPLWDTSIAEYIITGHTSKFASLADLAAKYCPDLGAKGDVIMKIIRDGGDTKDMKYDAELREYLRQDCKLTRAVAAQQMCIARELGCLRLIMVQCAALKAIAEMEFNGIEFDLKRCSKAQKEVDEAIGLIQDDIAMMIHGAYSVLLKDIDAWINSPAFWSRYFFGGTYTFKYKVPVGTWKSGKKKGAVRYKTEEEVIEFPRQADPVAVGSARGANGNFSVDESVINKLSLTFTTAKLLREMRKLSKLSNTYLKALPTKMFGKYIHTNLHQVSTDTGRLSSSNPNLQNIESGESSLVKTLFIPGDGAWFIEADYKQLEVVALAYDTQDPQLIDDIKQGIDIHDVISKMVYGPVFSKDERRVVKTVNFGTIYGGGVQTIAKQSNLDEKMVWEIRNHFFTRYPHVKEMRKHTMNMLSKATKFTVDAKIYGHLTSVTGRRYTIPMDKRYVGSGIEYQPHYTKVCNYPIQGLATGDIVPMMLAHMWRWINERRDILNGKLLMRNTVHDSILFSWDGDHVKVIAENIKRELESAPEIFNRIFKPTKPFDLPLNVDVQYTKVSWGEDWFPVDPF